MQRCEGSLVSNEPSERPRSALRGLSKKNRKGLIAPYAAFETLLTDFLA